MGQARILIGLTFWSFLRESGPCRRETFTERLISHLARPCDFLTDRKGALHISVVGHNPAAAGDRTVPGVGTCGLCDDTLGY